MENVRRLFEKNQDTGECRSGLYLWAADMVLVEKLTLGVVRKSIEDLLDKDEFFSAFSRLDEP